MKSIRVLNFLTDVGSGNFKNEDESGDPRNNKQGKSRRQILHDIGQNIYSMRRKIVVNEQTFDLKFLKILRPKSPLEALI